MALAESLKQVFVDGDQNGAGCINRNTLEMLLRSLEPGLSDVEIQVLFGASGFNAATEVNYSSFIDFLTKPLTAIPQELLKFFHGDSGTKIEHAQLTQLKEYLRTATPSERSVCQAAAVKSGLSQRLLVLAGKDPDLRKRCIGLNVLREIVLGSEEAVIAVTSDPAFLPCIHSAMCKEAPLDLQLSALLVVHTCGACLIINADQVLSDVVPFVTPALSADRSGPFVEIAVDILGLCALHCRSTVVASLSWPVLADIVAEDENRPLWLPRTPLQILSCGLLAAAVLQESRSNDEQSENMRNAMISRLEKGRFVEYLVAALKASVTHEEWPSGSGVFHLSFRLAMTVGMLANRGYCEQLMDAIVPLSDLVMKSLDARTSSEAALALRILSQDLDCLHKVLSLSSFRLCVDQRVRRKSDPVLSDLLAYLTEADDMLSSANIARESLKSCENAPSVTDLARLFMHFRPLVNTMSVAPLMEALRMVPIGPCSAVKTTLASLSLPSKVSFQEFAKCVYGTAGAPGLWPVLMESPAQLWKATKCNSSRDLPDLCALLEAYERAQRSQAAPLARCLIQEIFWLPAKSNINSESKALLNEFETKADETISFQSFVEFLTGFFKYI